MEFFFNHLYSELRRGYNLENDEQRYSERRQKLYSFLKVPIELERFMFQAYFHILDAFLFIFTILPIRFLLSCWFTISRTIINITSKFFLHQRRPRFHNNILKSAEICDILQGIILASATVLLTYIINPSNLYHMIKSHSTIKLYLLYNMLEVADKLMSTFGCDVLDALFLTATEHVNPNERNSHRFYTLCHLVVAILYVSSHSSFLLGQATILNVALNSKSKSLLIIMMSSNFVELKGMVFKKFDKNSLFQMSGSDVRERHHLLVLLIVVMLQTLKEYHWDEKQMFNLLPYCILILVMEVLVDWCKHAFVTRFNEINSEIYREYTKTLAFELTSSKLTYADHSTLISKRMGFIPLPLAAVVIRVFYKIFTITTWQGYLCLFLCYLCLLTFKILVNIILLGNRCGIILKQREQQQQERANLKIRRCASMPSSKHASAEDVPNLLVSLSQNHPKSTPQSPRTSLTDLTTKENLEQSFIFSDSTVSLTSLKVRPNN